MALGVAFGLMGAFFMGGMYVAAALGCLSLIVMMFFSDAPLWNIMANKAWEGNTSFILAAVPMFILMGELMNRSGMGERMYVTVTKWLWFLPGGLIHTNIVSCAIFAACSGSSVATSATIARVSLPAFRARGYNERLVLGSLAAGGTLGILIPPSIAFIIYGVLVEESIGRLYLAGFLPGFMLAGLFMVMIGIVAIIWKEKVAPKPDKVNLRDMAVWMDRIAALISLIPIIGLIFIVLGTIYLGIATPSEAAAFGVSGGLVLGILLNAQNIWRGALAWVFNRSGASIFLPRSVRMRVQATQPPRMVDVKLLVDQTGHVIHDAVISTMRTTGMIFLIVLAAFTLSFAFARLGISQDLADAITSLNLTATTLVIVLVFFYLVLGTFMESFSMLVTTVPILVPTFESLGVDLVWFGVIMVILVEAALISPPEGVNLYVMHGIRQDITREMADAEGVEPVQGTIADVWIGVAPFMICMAVAIALLIAFPDIALWLPNQVKGVRG
jgi:TRAP-type C4-dicarboxylate transport system permease large subunit